VPYLAIAFLILLLAAPPGAFAQAGVSYQIPPDNPFAGQAGAAPEVYALGLRNPFRFSFDRQTGDVLIGDVGQMQREEIDWIGSAAIRGANFGWPCREGTIDGPRPDQCPVAGAVEPLFDYGTAGFDAVTGGYVVRDPSLTGLTGRYLYADFFAGEVRSLALDFSAPDDQSTGLAGTAVSSFGEDASARLYAASLTGNQVYRLKYGGSPGTLSADPVGGPYGAPIALATYPGDASRLFVAERGGQVKLLVNDVLRPTPYLDLAPLGVSQDGERGLLSVAAAPNYSTTGKFYVYYTETGGDIRVDELTRSSADPDTADLTTRRNLLTIEHSSENNHNGGQLHFGADGCLWITTGDGGGGNDLHNNAQNLSTLLGKLLRINPDPPGISGAACDSPPLGVPPPPPHADTVAPRLAVRAKPRQRVLRHRGAIVYVRCNEHCSVNAGGTLHVGRRTLRLRRVPAAVVANTRTRLHLPLRSRGARVLRRALRERRHPKVTLRLRAADAAGNHSGVVRRVVRVRR
jgi:glucose/arabinose dehydrogenase